MRLTQVLNQAGPHAKLTPRGLSAIGCDIATQLTYHHSQRRALGQFGLSDIVLTESGGAQIVPGASIRNGAAAPRNLTAQTGTNAIDSAIASDVIALALTITALIKHTHQTSQTDAIQHLARRVAASPIPVGTFAAQLAGIAKPEPISVAPRLPASALILASSWLALAATGFGIGLRIFQQT